MTPARAHALEYAHFDRLARQQRSRSPRAYRVLAAIAPVYCAIGRKRGYHDPVCVALLADSDVCNDAISSGEDIPEEMAGHMLARLEDKR